MLSVLQDGYRIHFLGSPLPLACIPISFPTYRSGSPQSLVLGQEIEKMLAKDAWKIVFGLGPGFYSRLFLVEKAPGGWHPVIDPSHLNGFCSTNTVQGGGRSLPATLRLRGGFPSFNRPERCIFPNTRSSGIEEAIEVPVGRGSLLVQSPVLRTVDCPSGLHQGVCSCLCVVSLSQDLSSQVPGRLASPHLLRDRGQKERSGSALALSLPRDSDKRGEVRSRTLADCKLPWYNHRYRGRQDFSCPCVGREISVGGGEFFVALSAPPAQLWQVLFGHLALLERLVTHSCLRMRSLQWYLKTHWSPESDPRSLLVPLSR